MSNRQIVCKMHCGSVRSNKNESGQYCSEEIEMFAVTSYGDPTNKAWSDATPTASFKATINNKDAWGVILPGKKYLVTIEEAPE